MSYHVLARRWRPQTFSEMVGQEHVLKALTNALSHDRLHHAYLFTGTRGVGKTTVARIFAKSLNCEEGVGPNPCGVCSACTEIAEGRFVDLIEVDAASRTKVEDTRELLENVQYAPSRGRFKVYIIDEVHMLSTSSFNALLKTLEEPPEHVKFLLATTDPQKLPVTVLSRCLQFNLKNMSPERIVSHLQFVLGEENVPFEEPALWLLAKAADGSMRDALSLTDQSIAFGNESVLEADVRNMLGTVDRAYVLHILEALAAQDAAKVLQEVTRAADHAPDFAGILDELIATLHRIGVAQMVPSAIDNSQGDQEYIMSMAQAIQVHDVQLFYQIALSSRKDMLIAADQRAALEMTLLRMLAFQIKRPGQVPAVPNAPLPNAQEVAPAQATGLSPQTSSSVETNVTPDAASQEGTEDGKKSLANNSPELTSGDSSNLEKASDASISEAGASPESSNNTVVEHSSVVAPWQEHPDNSFPDEALNNPPPKETEAVHAELEPTPQDVQPVPTQASPEPLDTADASDVTCVTETPAENPMSSGQSNLAPAETAATEPVHAEPVLTEQVDPSSDWISIEAGLGLSSFNGTLAANMVPIGRADTCWQFVLKSDMETFLKPERVQVIAEAISQRIGKSISIEINSGDLPAESPAEYRLRKKAERLQKAVSDFNQDQNVIFWKEKYGARVLDETIVPIDL